MNILYWLRQFPKLSESFVINEIVELSRRGHDIAIFALSDPQETLEHREVAELNLPITYATLPPRVDLGALVGTSIYDRNVIQEAAHLINPLYNIANLYLTNQCVNFISEIQFEPDIVHSHFATMDKLAAQYVSAQQGCAHVITAHSFEIFSNVNWKLLNMLFQRCDQIITPSDYNKEYLETHWDPTFPIEIIPATTNVEKFSPSETECEYRLLTVGRLVEKKGIRYAIEAVAKLRHDFPDISYRIVGSGELKPDLQELAKELDVENHVEFLGNISDQRLIYELGKAAVFVLPCIIAQDGDRDVIPVVLKEAMGTETACVSTMISGIPELIENGDNGLLVPEKNAIELARAIESLITEQDFRSQLALNGHNTVREKFDIRYSVDKLEDVFEEL